MEPSPAVALQYMKGLQSPQPYRYSFRLRNGMFAPVPAGIMDFQQTITSTYFTERPQMIWVGFQNQCNVVNQTMNRACYYHENIQTAYIQMNNTQFPTVKVEADWTQNDYGFFYEMQEHVRANYLQIADTYSEGNMLNPVNFKDLYLILCFDVSKQESSLGSNSITCDLHVKFRAATPDNLRVYIVWFNDRTLEMHTDGSPITILNQTDNY